nr:myb-like protein A [Dermatophagoides farinae]
MSKSSDSKSTTTTTSGPIKMMKLIEIIRSKYGYGFTLSGEMPCRLTHVKGHARLGGLRSGDRLHVVNGQNVDTFTHDQVVELITSVSDGRLLLQVSAASIDDSFHQRQFNSTSAKITTSESISMMIDEDRKSSISALTTSKLPQPQQQSIQQLSIQKYRPHRNARNHHHYHRNNHRTIPHNHRNYHTKKHRSMKNNQFKRQQQQEPQSSTTATTILSPSETYQDECRISSSRYHYRNKPRFKDHKRNNHHHNRYNKNGDQSCNSDGDIHTNVAEHFDGLWKRASNQSGTPQQKQSYHSFKSIDNLLDRFQNYGNHKDDDELLLHQHYRNHQKLEQRKILQNLYQTKSNPQFNEMNSFKVHTDVHHHHQYQRDYHNTDGKLFSLSLQNVSIANDKDSISNEQQSTFMNKNKNKISKTKTNSTTSGFSSISQSPSSSTSTSSQSSSSSSSSPPELFVSNASSQSTTTTTLTDRDHHSQAIFRSIKSLIMMMN